MPLPLTVSCFSKVQIGFTFLVPAHLGSPGQRAVKRVCVCVVLLVAHGESVDGESVVRVVDKPISDVTVITRVLVSSIHVHNKRSTFAVLIYRHCVHVLHRQNNSR